MGKNKNPNIVPLFETQAISDQKQKLQNSKVSIPSEQSVKEAKKWVDDNEK